MKDLKPCPIPGCNVKWRKTSYLFAHLFQRHKKADLIKWMIEHLDPVGAWRKRALKEE